MVPWEKTVLSQTPSGHAAVDGRGREESADLRSMRTNELSHCMCFRSCRYLAQNDAGHLHIRYTIRGLVGYRIPSYLRTV